MKKVVLGYILAFGLVYASEFTISVESGSMKYAYDGDPLGMIKKGFHRPIKCMESVEILEGDGKLAVLEDGQKIRTLTKDSPSYALPAHKCDSGLKAIIVNLKGKVSYLFATNEVISLGVTKGTDADTEITKDLSISSLDDNIMLYSQEWGGYDFRLEIIRADKVIETSMFTDLTADYHYFIIPTKLLKDGDSYRVVSGVGKEEWKKEIVSQSGKITFTK